MKISLHSLVFLLVFAVAVPTSAQTTWYVDDDCVAPGSGTEVDPFCKIQDGINAAFDGDVVLVARGTYTGEGNRDISLSGKAIIVKSTDGPSGTVLDINGGPSAIHGGFFLIHGESQETVIEGFTITNGYLVGDTGGSGIGGGGGGAAIFIRASSPIIRDCVLVNNTAASIGNPFPEDGRGGAVYVDEDSQAILEHCIIADNWAERGGGIHISSYCGVIIRNCLIIGNQNDDNNFGGGINAGRNTTIVNTTVAYNISGGPAGGVSAPMGTTITNSTIWGNEAAFAGDQLTISDSLAPLDPVFIEYSNIEGGSDAIAGDDDGFIWGSGMIDDDPLFVDPENGDFRFLHGSPCIDAGDNLSVPEGVVIDLDGDPRFLDDPDTRDTGNPDPDAPKLPIVDMGPYEYDPDDCNNNDIPDAEELANGSSQDCDGENGNGIPDECEADCNANDQADSCDIALGVSEDCTGNAIPDECEPDCNENGEADTCDIADGVSEDCTDNGIPDECEPDCNDNGIADSCDIADQTSPDCNDNAVPDECEEGADCNGNGQLDSCDLAEGSSVDCSPGGGDGVPDECCPGNSIADDEVGPFDLAALLGTWGPCPDSCIEGIPTCSCAADFNNDCTVNPFDLATLLANWGPCP